jgi:uncharacterized protein
MAGYWLAGLWVPLVTRYYLLSLPGAIVAIPLGRMLNRRLHNDAFLRCAYAGLLAAGLVLLAQVFAAH